MECRQSFHCPNADYIHYRLHKMEINCQYRIHKSKLTPVYYDADFLKIDNKGRTNSVQAENHVSTISVDVYDFYYNTVNPQV